MRLLWLLLLILAICLVLTECRRSRKRKHRRTKTTTTPAPVVEEPEEEEEENEEVTPWEGVSQDQSALADDFFKDFDEDNIIDNDEEPAYINKPEVVNFFAKFPRRKQDLIQKEMYEEKQKKNQLPDGGWQKRINFVDSLYYRNTENGPEKRVSALVVKQLPNVPKLKLFITFSPNSQSFGDVDVEVKVERDAVPGKSTISSKTHGWNPESFTRRKTSVINLQGQIGEIYLRNLGYFKEYKAKNYSSKMCVEMYLYNHHFGSVVCLEMYGTKLTNIQNLTLMNNEHNSLWTVYDQGSGFDDLETYIIEKSTVAGKTPLKTPLNDQELYRKYLKNK